MKKKILLIFTIFLLISLAYGNEQKNIAFPSNGSGEIFLYEAKKFGLPILKALISIEHKLKNERPLYQIHADIKSLPSLGFLFRMKNHFTSLMDGETLFPLRYIKEIDQEGLLIKKKNYNQTITFDYSNGKLVIEKMGNYGQEEIHLSPKTYDPLSIFARYYLRGDLIQEPNIDISVFDGIKLKHMVFHLRRGMIKTKILGEVEAICLESSTSFSSFGEKEGIIRIWYKTVGERVPVLIELDLPVGDVKFELKEVKKVGTNGSKEEGKEEI